MSNMKGGHTQSFKDVRATFPDSSYGSTELSLAVGQELVAIINSSQLKGTVTRKGLRENTGNLLVAACRKYDPEKFDQLCTNMEAVTIA